MLSSSALTSFIRIDMARGSAIRFFGAIIDLAAFLLPTFFISGFKGFVAGIVLAIICSLITEKLYNRFATKEEKIADLEDRVRNGDV